MTVSVNVAGDHSADDALMAYSFGVLDRQAAIAAVEQAPPWSTLELVEPRVVEPYSAVISSAFVRRDGRWQLAFHQQTPI